MTGMSAITIAPRLRDSLGATIGGDPAIEQVLERKDVESLLACEGIGLTRALDWVRKYHGYSKPSVSQTEAAKVVEQEVRDALMELACTRHGRNQLRLLAEQTDPTTAQQLASDRYTRAIASKDWDWPSLRRHLGKLHRLGPAKPVMQASMCILCETDEQVQVLQEARISSWATVFGPEDLEMAAGYDLIIHWFDDGRLPVDGLPNLVELPGSTDPRLLVPARALEPLRRERALLLGLEGLSELTGRATVATQLLEQLDRCGPEPLEPATLQKIVRDLAKEATAKIEAEFESLAISAREVMAAAAQNKLPASISQRGQAILKDSVAELYAQTGIRFSPFELALPVIVDEEEVRRALAQIASTHAIEQDELQRKAAKIVLELESKLAREIDVWLDQDAELAIDQFILKHDLRPATFGPALELRNAIHLGLTQVPGAQRVHYQLGNNENVALLTGANSGGKSTFLEMLTQVQWMAQVGLPVCADATLAWVEEIHLVTPKKGLDAGAFETFLRSFLPLVGTQKPRLVLADEVEAITELEAAAKILGFMLDRLADQPGLTVLVTHLATQLRAELPSRVRIDGIEAKGLDEKHQLIVDRQPAIGVLARSTPELIVARMAAVESGEIGALCRELLGKFQATT